MLINAPNNIKYHLGTSARQEEEQLVQNDSSPAGRGCMFRLERVI